MTVHDAPLLEDPMTEPNSAAADSLLAIDHPLGARRLIVEIDYFETYDRPNVTLVDGRPLQSPRSHPGVCGPPRAPTTST